MRKGKNISKNKLVNNVPCHHRVIIPLFIPSTEGYYQDALAIFNMCIQSIIKTSCSPIKISVISNGSCEKVNDRLYQLQKSLVIDELIIEREGIGKINSVLKALRTADERLITITDADVLFLNNWENEVLKVFEVFPKAGMVSPVPIFRTQLRYTANIWMDYMFSNKLKFRPVKNPEALTRFANSLNWSYLGDHLKDVILTIKERNVLAVVGNAHFVGTYKKEVFDFIPKTNSAYKLGGSSERLYTDLPVIKSNGYKLATYDNYAYHLGNKKEDWMDVEFDKLKIIDKQFKDLSFLNKLNPSRSRYFLSEKIVAKLFFIKRLKKIIYKNKGLSKTQLDHFLKSNYE
jgi:hypothetical protein